MRLLKRQSFEGEKEFLKLRKAIRDYTLCDLDRLNSLWKLVRGVKERGIKGDIVECGSYKGGTGALLRAGMGPGRKLWIYDSFQGMPETTHEDGEEAKKWKGSCAASAKDVIEVLGATGAKKEEFVIREGWFNDTFKKELPQQVALLHCDADWYDSVTLVLETFYPIMPAGGCVVLDDFGYWEGCRRAFYDFCGRHGEKPLLERVGVTQAWWIKGKEHNREG